MTQKSSKSLRIFWRIRDGRGVIGRLGQRGIETVREAAQRLKIPESAKQEEGEERAAIPPPFGSEIVPEQNPDESHWKANLVDKSRDQKPRKKTRVV